MSYELRSFLLRELLSDIPVVYPLLFVTCCLTLNKLIYLLQQASVSSLVAKVMAQLEVGTKRSEADSRGTVEPLAQRIGPVQHLGASDIIAEQTVALAKSPPVIQSISPAQKDQGTSSPNYPPRYSQVN